MPTNDEWLTTAQAAELLGIRTRDLYRMIDDGTVPVHRVGRGIRIRRDDLDL